MRDACRAAGPAAGSPGLLAGTASYLTASVLWGLNIPLTSSLLQRFDPLWLSTCRYVIASVVLGACVAASLGPGGLRSPIPLWRVAVLSLAIACFLGFFTVGLLLTHPVTAAAVIAGAPVYAAVVLRAMTGARLARGFRSATALTILGAGIAIAGRTGIESQGPGLQGGEPLLMMSIATWTVYSILAQRWFAPEVPQLRRTFLSSIGALPWLLGFWLLARAFGWVGAPHVAPDRDDWLALVASAVLCTALATVAWNLGVARLGVAAGSLWQNAVPVFAVLISLVAFGVVPTGAQVLGGAVVMAGVGLMQWHTLRAARQTRVAAG